MGPRSCLDIFEEVKILLSLLEFEHQWSSTKPITTLTVPSQLKPILGGKIKMGAIVLLQFLISCMKYFFQMT